MKRRQSIDNFPKKRYNVSNLTIIASDANVQKGGFLKMEEPYRIGWQIKVISNLIKREVKKGEENGDAQKYSDELTKNNMFIIGYLAEHRSEDVFQKDLEAFFSVRRSTMSTIIFRMEQKGFLTRESVSHDARLKKLVLTEKGERVHAMIESGITDTEKKLTAGLSEEERQTLCHLLGKLRRNLESDN